MYLHTEVYWQYNDFMSNTPLMAVLRLIRVEATLQARFTGALASVHGLSLNDLILLMTLGSQPNGRMRRVDLAVVLAMSQSSVTRMAIPLEKIGLIARDSDVRDGRVAYVVLTKTGSTRAREAKTTLTHLSENVFAERFTAAEIKALTYLLGKLSTPLPGVPSELA
jgi:DNA-binding MarR family transcriptional regulator